MLPFKFLTLNDKKIINIFNCTLDFDSDGITLQFFFYKFIFYFFFNVGLYLQTRMDLKAV